MVPLFIIVFIIETKYQETRYQEVRSVKLLPSISITFPSRLKPVHRHTCNRFKNQKAKQRGESQHYYWHFGFLCFKPHRLCTRHMAEHQENLKPGPSKSHIARQKEREQQEKVSGG